MTKAQAAQMLSIDEAREQLAKSEEKVEAAIAALGPASDAIAAAQKDLEERESAFVNGEDINSRAGLEKARRGIEQARGDVQWAELEHRAALAAEQRAYVERDRAAHKLTQAEYLAEHRRFNAPEQREDTLLDQLNSIITELVPLLYRRRATHNRLAQKYSMLPDEDKFPIPPGERILAYPYEGSSWNVEVRHRELLTALESAINAGERMAVAEGTSPRQGLGLTDVDARRY